MGASRVPSAICPLETVLQIRRQPDFSFILKGFKVWLNTALTPRYQKSFSAGPYSLKLMTVPIWCRACNALILIGFSVERNRTSTPVSLGQMDLKSKLIAAIAKVWFNRQDGIGARPRADDMPKGCPFLFPGDVPGQPVVDLKRFWERMRVQADIPDVRIHDLRHTFASLLVSGGASLEMIRRLLGHTQIGTTQRYAHLIDSPLRAGVNAVGEMLKPRLRAVGE